MRFQNLVSLAAAAGLMVAALSSASAEDPATTLKVAELTFQTPAPWKQVPSASTMRAGTLQYAVEGVEKPLEAVFYYFGAGQGGDAKANVSRWLGQFQGEPESKEETIEAGGQKITLVHATGTYMVGEMFGPKTPTEGYTLLGGIVPGAEANIFIKLTGPKDAVGKVLEDFKKMIASPFVK